MDLIKHWERVIHIAGVWLLAILGIKRFTVIERAVSGSLIGAELAFISGESVRIRRAARPLAGYRTVGTTAY